MGVMDLQRGWKGRWRRGGARGRSVQCANCWTFSNTRFNTHVLHERRNGLHKKGRVHAIQCAVPDLYLYVFKLVALKNIFSFFLWETAVRLLEHSATKPLFLLWADSPSGVFFRSGPPGGVDPIVLPGWLKEDGSPVKNPFLLMQSPPEPLGIPRAASRQVGFLAPFGRCRSSGVVPPLSLQTRAT